MITIANANALHIPLPNQSVQCIVTSPPYYGLRDYGIAGQIGLESTPAAYVASIIAVMRECWRVLKDDGVLWLNLGDSYAANRGNGASGIGEKQATNVGANLGKLVCPDGLKPKDLIGIPWRVAFALQDDGWYLRQDIIWHKPNPMPESVTDRCTKAHEYIFLLTKRARYYYDAEAIKESSNNQGGQAANFARATKEAEVPGQNNKSHRLDREPTFDNGQRNRRSVWTVATQPYSGAHFATFPPALIEPMILAGSRRGDVILDPFAGSGTTGAVAVKHGRRAVLLDLNTKYIDLQFERTNGVQIMMPV